MPISKEHLKDIQESYQELEIQINRFLSVRTKNDRIVIYVNGKLFTHCKFLVMNVPKEDEKQEYINSIDQAEVLYGENQQLELSLKDRLIGHASNLQAWAENDYNTTILHRNLAFPLLKRLVEAHNVKRLLRIRLDEQYFAQNLATSIF